MRDARQDDADQQRAELEAVAARLEKQIRQSRELLHEAETHLADVRRHLQQLDRQDQG